jgi:hypothetical protein
VTADVINLRRSRKARDRQAKSAEADANRIRFGRTKAEKERLAAEKKRAADLIERHRRETD